MKQLVITERENLVAIANAVRSNSDITSRISLDGIASGINYVANYVAANAGGVDTSDATASAGDILQGETAYADGQKITGTFSIDNELATQDDLIAQIQTALEGKAGGSAEPVLQDKSVTPSTTTQTVTPDSGYDGLSKVTVNAMPTATQATPSITVNSSGLITASATQTAGYVSAGTKSGTKQLTVQAAKTVTPTKSSQTAVAKGKYTTGAVTVAAIPAQYITTTDATATATDILSGKTAYVNGSKVTGSVATFDGSYECSGDSTGGSGSGGASVETCTVTINNASSYYAHCYATVFEDGGNQYKQVYLSTNTNTTITNVLRNTVIMVHTNITNDLDIVSLSNAILKSSSAGLLVFMVGTEGSGNCEIVYKNSNNHGGGSN